MAGSKGATTKESIRHVAMVEFRERGFRGTTLDDIASRLGITRAAVIHHFGSKAMLFEAVVGPYLESLAEIWDRYGDGPEPLSHDQAGEMIDLCIEVCARYRMEAGIVFYEATVDDPGLRCRIEASRERFTRLLSGCDPAPAQRGAALAALGSLARPLTDPSLALDNPSVRAVIRDLALSAAGFLAPKAMDTAPPTA